MFHFKIYGIDDVDTEEYEKSLISKNFFSTTSWLRFLSEFRKVHPVIVRITDREQKFVGYFTGATFSRMGIKFLGSPFYGWIGLQMGFDFADLNQAQYPEVLDELIDFLRKELRISFFIMTDYKITAEHTAKCRNHFFIGETESKTYFLDMNKTEDELFMGFNTKYRNFVRRFAKDGGTIEEDYSDEFIEEHNRQLKDVFARKNLTAPDYSGRMHLLKEKYPDMILFIKALDAEGKNVASSYYVGDSNMAFFCSNASYTESLNTHANQALMWYAIQYWKKRGTKMMDLAGSGDYKAKFGSVYATAPIIIWAKHKWEYELIQWLRKMYYMQFRVKDKIVKLFRKEKNEENGN